MTSRPVVTLCLRLGGRVAVIAFAVSVVLYGVINFRNRDGQPVNINLTGVHRALGDTPRSYVTRRPGTFPPLAGPSETNVKQLSSVDLIHRKLKPHFLSPLNNEHHKAPSGSNNERAMEALFTDDTSAHMPWSELLPRLLVAPRANYGRGGQGYTAGQYNEIAARSDMLQRRELLSRRCASRSLDTSLNAQQKRFRSTRFIINEHRLAMACVVPKAGSTNLRALFVEMAGTLNHTDPLYNFWFNSTDQGMYRRIAMKYRALGIKRGWNYGITLKSNWQEEKDMKYITHVASQYTSIMTVRHPFERVISAFRDKILKPKLRLDSLKKSFLSYLKMKGGYNGTLFTVAHFPDFVDMLIVRGKNKSLNAHVAPSTLLCNPCEISYDYIIKFETLPRDGRFVVQDSGLSKFAVYPPPAPNFKYSGTPTSELTTEYFSNIPNATIYALYKLYRDDFQLFGYV